MVTSYVTYLLSFVKIGQLIELNAHFRVHVDRISLFESRQESRIFIFTTASRPALGPTQPPIQWVPGALSLGVKWPGREADHSPPSSAEVKELVDLYLHSPNTLSWRRAQLKKAQGLYLLPSPLKEGK
jgi:hypothetical protein